MERSKVEIPCREWQGPRDKDGYGVIMPIRLHRWIVELVDGHPLALGEIVMHTCDNPPCFLYAHLRRGRVAENNADRSAKGRNRDQRGEKHNMAKITISDVQRIRELSVEGWSHRRIAARFDVSHTQIGRIMRGSNWKHVVDAS